MILTKFHIIGYKSIIDSGICNVCSDLTILAGKNETGKTSILEALRDFNKEVILGQSIQPKFDKDIETKLTLWFDLDSQEVDTFNRQFSAKIDVKVFKTVGFEKTTAGYSITFETMKIFGTKEPDGYSISIERLDLLLSMVPNFILFDSFNDIIPDSIPIGQIKDNPFMLDLCMICGLDTKILASNNMPEFVKHKDQINKKLNNDYKQFWIQDNAIIRLECNNNIVSVLINEGGEFFLPKQRSKGKQWHLAFYIRIKARAQSDRRNVILIDEPGLFLHASAQKDIYKMLLSLHKTSQVIFTTHSPYLIRHEELHRLKLITKVDTQSLGTQISNKVHACCDKETLTPILTSIGLELNDGIQQIGKRNNVVVEGPSDCFYFQAMARYLKVDDLNFVFGGGAGNMGYIGTILSGWGCNVVYLYDKDQGKTDGEKNLTKTWRVSKDLIQSVSTSAGSVEDLFNKKDFQNHILDNATIPIKGSISSYLKINRINKVTLASKFAQLSSKIDVELDQSTIKNFSKLFLTLKELLESCCD